MNFSKLRLHKLHHHITINFTEKCFIYLFIYLFMHQQRRVGSKTLTQSININNINIQLALTVAQTHYVKNGVISQPVQHKFQRINRSRIANTIKQTIPAVDRTTCKQCNMHVHACFILHWLLQILKSLVRLTGQKNDNIITREPEI